MIPGPNWARRYGSHHRRLCARPGCGAIAAATLRFQPTQREAWLVELDMTSPRTEGDLCARHAAALVLPRGWQLHDERIERPEVDEDETAARPKRRPAPRTPRPALRAVPEPHPQLELEPGRVTETATAPAPEPEADQLTEIAIEVEIDAVRVREAEAELEPEAEDEDAAAAEAALDSKADPQSEPAVAADASPPAIADLDDVFDVHTPLLRRAFENVVWPVEGDND